MIQRQLCTAATAHGGEFCPLPCPSQAPQSKLCHSLDDPFLPLLSDVIIHVIHQNSDSCLVHREYSIRAEALH